MNLVSAALNVSMSIDVCIIGQAETPILEYAASLTGGLFVRLERLNTLTYNLNNHFVSDYLSHPALRKRKSKPMKSKCFCHLRPIDKGYLCTSCYSVLCCVSVRCIMCKSVFR